MPSVSIALRTGSCSRRFVAACHPTQAIPHSHGVQVGVEDDAPLASGGIYLVCHELGFLFPGDMLSERPHYKGWKEWDYEGKRQ